MEVAENPSQLSICVEQLQACIAWDKSIMKVYCQVSQLECYFCAPSFCSVIYCNIKVVILPGNKSLDYQVCCKGGADHLLLLCDSCDRGFHTYCCTPPLEKIPEDDWFCLRCVANNTPEDMCTVCSTKVQSPHLLYCLQSTHLLYCLQATRDTHILSMPTVYCFNFQLSHISHH